MKRLQLGIEEHQREACARRRMRSGADAPAGNSTRAVVDRGPSPTSAREIRSVLRRSSSCAVDERREELVAQPFGVDAERDEARQLVARGKTEAQLRLEVGPPPVDHRLRRREIACFCGASSRKRLTISGPSGTSVVKPCVLAIVGEHLVAVLDRSGPTRRRTACTNGSRLEPLLERSGRSPSGSAGRSAPADTQQHVDVGRLQRVLDASWSTPSAVSWLSCRRTTADERPSVGDRSELKVEQHRDRNGDRDREPAGQPQACDSRINWPTREGRRLGRRMPRSRACPSDSSLLGFDDLANRVARGNRRSRGRPASPA